MDSLLLKMELDKDRKIQGYNKKKIEDKMI